MSSSESLKRLTHIIKLNLKMNKRERNKEKYATEQIGS